MGAELLHADGQIDMTKLILAFRNFANVPNNGLFQRDTENDDVPLVTRQNCAVGTLRSY